MKKHINPFEYEAASKFSPNELLEYYIEDFNYSRFIHSKRNVFLFGERGTGKTMTLRYYSLTVQLEKANKTKSEIDVSTISVYVPCNTPLTHRKEYELLDELQASICSEHFLAISIMYAVINEVSQIEGIMDDNSADDLRVELEYVLDINLPKDIPLFRAFSLFLDRTNVSAQKALNSKKDDIVFPDLISFNSGVRPLLASLTRLPKLKSSHFSLMIDDAQLLNPYQVRALNSWIAFRDNSLFSFKVATAKVDSPSLETSSGGSILEGHDFTRIDMEQPYHNKLSAFGKLARKIIERRLEAVNVKVSPDEFFPEHPQLIKDLEEATAVAKKLAEEKYPSGTSKQIGDYIYKYARAIYFRTRSKRANLPLYSGFDTIVHLSTGVIRNLLDPCYWMYDREFSERGANNEPTEILVEKIPPGIQSEIIQERSKKKWEWAKDELDKTIEHCSRGDAKRVYQLLDKLAILFKKRLLEHESEPRAVMFTISGFHEDKHQDLMKVIKVARKAQLLYTFTSSAKAYGKRETYYMPNHILWPQRGLDTHGQHARVSIRAEHLLNAAERNIDIPFQKGETKSGQSTFYP